MDEKTTGFESIDSQDRNQSDKLLTMHAFSGIFRMFTQVLAMMILVPIIIKHVGEEKYGIWTLGMAIMGILAFLEFGLIQASNRFLSAINFREEPEKMQQWTCTTFWLTLISGIAVIVVGIPFSDKLALLLKVPEIVHAQATFVVFVFIWRLAISVPLRNFSAVLLSQRFMARAHLSQGLSTILYFVCGVWVLDQGYELNGLAIAFFATMLVEHLAYAIMSLKIVPLKSYRLKNFNGELVPKIVEFSMFAWLGQITNVIFMRAGVLLVQVTSGLVANGAYSIAMRLSSISAELAAQVTYAGSPKIAKLSTEEDSGLGKAGWLTLTLARRAMVLSGILAAIAVPLGGCFLEGWVGGEMAKIATVPLAIMTMSIFLGTPYNASANSLSLSGEHRFTNVTALVVVALYIPIAIVGGQYFGPTGVALAGMITTVFMMLPAFMIRARKHLEIRLSNWLKFVYGPHFLPFFASLSISSLVSWAIQNFIEKGRLWMVLSAVAGVIIACIYVLIFLMYTAPEEERGILKKILNKVGIFKG